MPTATQKSEPPTAPLAPPPVYSSPPPVFPGPPPVRIWALASPVRRIPAGAPGILQGCPVPAGTAVDSAATGRPCSDTGKIPVGGSDTGWDATGRLRRRNCRRRRCHRRRRRPRRRYEKSSAISHHPLLLTEQVVPKSLQYPLAHTPAHRPDTAARAAALEEGLPRRVFLGVSARLSMLPMDPYSLFPQISRFSASPAPTVSLPFSAPASPSTHFTPPLPRSVCSPATPFDTQTCARPTALPPPPPPPPSNAAGPSYNSIGSGTEYRRGGAGNARCRRV